MNKKKEIVPALVVILFGVLYYAFSFRIQATTSDILGSRFFPQAAAILVIVLSLIQILLEVRKKPEVESDVKVSEETSAGEENAAAADTADAASDAEAKRKSVAALAMTVLALFGYYILIRLVGFTITSVLYLLFESWVLMSDKDRKNRKMTITVIITSILVPVFLNTVFYNVFRIKLPTGSLFR